MAELKPYAPSLRDRLAALLAGDAKPGSGRYEFVEGLMGSTGLGNTGPGPGGSGLVDFLPGGQAFAAQEAARQGDFQGAGLAIMPIPGASRSQALAGRLRQMPGAIPGKPSSVEIPGVGRVDAAPIQEIQDAADAYMAKAGRPGEHRIEAYPEFDEENAKRIAEAFEAMKHDPADPATRRSYDAMIQETLDQYKSLKDAGIDIEFIPDGMGDPYARSPALGYKDLIENGHLWVFPTDQGFGTLNAVADNPLLQRVGKVGNLDNATANDAFRAVHDLYGHFGPGNPFFRHKGEERAWINHSQMYSPEARGAMTTETRGQNSWLNFGPYAEHNRTALGADTVFADQKIGLLPDWAQQIVRKYGMAGVSMLPVAMQMQLMGSDEPATEQ